MRKIQVMIMAVVLTACTTVGPDFQSPTVQTANHWAGDNRSVRNTPAHTADWWKVFHDPVLTSLIERGYHHNLSLQAAGVSVLQARAQLAQSVGMLYPQQQTLTGNYVYQRIGGSSLSGLLPSSFNTDSIGVAANWEIDFWGKYRRAIQSNDANFLASLAAYDAALVTLTAEIASTYVNICTYEKLIQVTQSNIRIQKESLNIALSRFNAGETSLLDVEQAKTQLSETLASLPPLEANLQQQKDALAVLLGTTPNKVGPLLSGGKGIPKAPASVAVGIPKDLLRQRPDVQQAELQALAQSAAVGVQEANLYPALSLSGSFSFASSNINDSSTSDIFQWSNRTISFGPYLSLPIFNYGQLTNAVRAQDAAFQEAILNYQNVVLQAQQEVQDGIVSYVQSQKAVNSLIQANTSAERSTHLAMIRYKEGQTDYTTVLNAEQDQLSVQTSLTRQQGNVPQGLIALYRALGGGWQIRQGNDVVSDETKMEMAQRTNWGNLLEQTSHEAPKTVREQAQQTQVPNW